MFPNFIFWFMLIAGIIIIPVGAYLDTKWIKCHSFKQYLLIFFWEYAIFLFAFIIGIGIGKSG